MNLEERIEKLERRVAELDRRTVTMLPLGPAKQEPDPEFMKRAFNEAIERMKKNEN